MWVSGRGVRPRASFLVRLVRVCDSGLKRRFPVAQCAAIVMTLFAGVMVQKNVSRNRPPMGQRPHNLAAGNARGTGIKASEAVPEFTANAFADHHRRIRLAAHCEPKTMNSRRCSGGMPSTTLHFASNDKATARDFAP